MSSPEDWRRVHELRGEVDGIMVGINTILTDNPLLTNRSGAGKKPVRIVVDSSARMPLTSMLLQPPDPRVIIACSENADREAVAKLEKAGATIIELEEVRSSTFENRAFIDLSALLLILKEKEGIERLLLEGGSELNWGMLSRGLVDELRVCITPIVIGGKDSKSLVGGEGFSSIEESLKLTFVDSKPIHKTGEVLLTFRSKGDR